MMFTNRLALPSMVAMLLLVSVGCSSGTMAPGTSGAAAQGGAAHTANAMCQPDFTFALSPSSATITTGQSVRVSMEMSSLCGLAGTINVGITKVSPQPYGNGFTIKQPRYDIPLQANSTATAYITLGATPNTLKLVYTITITGEDISGGCCYGREHSATFVLTVK